MFLVWFAGQVIVGCSVSFTVTVNEQVLVLPAASVATNVLVVVPTGNVLPLGRPAVCCTTGGTSGQLSVTAGRLKFTIAPQMPGFVPVVILAGHMIVGGWVSFTLTVNEQLTAPQVLVAVTVTVVMPTLNSEPLPEPLPDPVVAPEKL